jgi:tetratricopeptide (TPR) repeat protein
MGVNNVVIPELSKKVVKHIVTIILAGKDKEDKPIRKICDQCIRCITFEKERDENTEKSIELITSKSSGEKAFYTLLLGILYDDLEEDEPAFKHFSEFAYSSLAEPFKEELLDFILLARFFNMEDYTNLEKVGLVFLNKYSEGIDAAGFLFQLSTHVNLADNIGTFQSLIDRAKELYPDDYALESFNGYLHNVNEEHEKALESFVKVKDNLEKEVDHPTYNLNLASLWNSIAFCQLKLKNSEKTIESCDTALFYNQKSEEMSIENSILCKKSEAFILQGMKDTALSLVNKVLENSPEDEEALAIFDKI